MSEPANTRVAVIGAGITGLSTAFRLHQQGFRVTVFERNEQVGGAVRTIRDQGYLIEAGPNSLQYGGEELKGVIRDAGLEPAVVPANPLAKRRFLVRNGRFVAVPSSPPAFLGTNLFGFRTKAAIFGELLMRPRIRTSDLNLAQFVRSHFTQELVDYAVNPLIAGIYAGDPERLSVKFAFPSLWEAERSHGSVIRGMIAGAKTRRARGEPSGPAPIVSFRDGLQSLPNTLASLLPRDSIRTQTTIEALIPGRPHRLVWRSADRTGADEFDVVVLAVPAGSLAQLVFGPLGERPLAALDNIPQPPVSSLFLGYRRDQVAHPLDGFGGLVPEVERRRVLGILFSSTLFPARAPEGFVGLTVFVGGMRQPELARLAKDQLLSTIEPDLHDLVGASGAPAYARLTQWPRAIPQYVLGYDRWLDLMNATEQRHSGLFIAGNVRDGISLPDCVKSGVKVAARVAAFAAA